MQDGLGQFQQQVLKQSLSLQQIQYVKLLAMSTPELNNYLDDLHAENPVVDVTAAAVSLQTPVSGSSAVDMAKWLHEKPIFQKAYDRNDENEGNEPFHTQRFNDERYDIWEHVKSQLDFSLSDVDLSLMQKIVSSLDSNGYLTVTAEQLSKRGVEYDLAVEAITYLKTLDPPGIGALDLRECLSLQLLRLGLLDEVTAKLISNHLEDLSHGYFQKVSKILSCDVKKVKEIYHTIRELNPRPAAGFGTESPTFILPDITITENASGDLVVNYNKHNSASLSVNNSYLLLAQQSEDTKAYINKKLSQALWVIKAVASRQNTIERIVSIIIEYHSSFFKTSSRTLSPLRLKDVSIQMEVHESTVSRAINEKYLECKKGVFPLKYFFSAAASATDNIETSISSRSVKEYMKDLISKEDNSSPLSDSAIASILSEKGMPLARRTVAKYREELNIPSSTIRKI